MLRERIGRHPLPALGHAPRRLGDPDPELHAARRRDHAAGTRLDDATHAGPRCAWIERRDGSRRGMLDRRRLPESRPQASIATTLEHDPARIAHDQGLPVDRRPRGLGRNRWNAIDRSITMGEASGSPWARLATGCPRRARERTELHQSLVQPGRRRSSFHQLLSRRPEPLLRGALGWVQGAPVDPQQHARHVSIDDGGSFSMHDARDRSRRVPTDARQGG